MNKLIGTLFLIAILPFVLIVLVSEFIWSKEL